MSNLLPPVTYQGGKARLAKQIVATLGLPAKQSFYDLCCGSGAVSIEAVSQGQNPASIVMIDASPWGLFWNTLGDGSFSLSYFEQVCNQVPTKLEDIKPYMEYLYKQPVGTDTVYIFLLLQAGSFGGLDQRRQMAKWQFP